MRLKSVIRPLKEQEINFLYHKKKDNSLELSFFFALNLSFLKNEKLYLYTL
jgi:hypothetical protein